MKLKYWNWWTIFITAIFLILFSMFGLAIFFGIKVVSQIEKYGLKSIVEQIWEGED